MQPKSIPVNSNSSNKRINCGKIIEQFQALYDVRILKAGKQTFISNALSPAGVKPPWCGALGFNLHHRECLLLHACCCKNVLVFK